MVGVEQSVVAVVDDDPRVLESLENLLESAGHVVRLFSSARAFLDHGGFAGIDCLISDVGMPEIDGIELQRMASIVRPELPIILITGRHELRCRQLAGKHCNPDFFRKPFDGRKLLAAVGNALAASVRGK